MKKRISLLIIPLLLLIAWSFYLPSRSAPAVGTLLQRALPPLPQAIPTLEYFPPAAVAALPAEPLTPSAVVSPDRTLEIEAYRLDAATLTVPRRALPLLRARVASTDWDAALCGALRELGYRFDAPAQIVAAARKSLLAQSDAALLLEYLRADRQTLAQTADLDRAVQLALLLVSTPMSGAAATFGVRGQTYYLLTTRDDLIAASPSATVVCLAADGRELFHGILASTDSPPASGSAGTPESLLPVLYRLAQSLTPAAPVAETMPLVPAPPVFPH